jgi:hypothetical protein
MKTPATVKIGLALALPANHMTWQHLRLPTRAKSPFPLRQKGDQRRAGDFLAADHGRISCGFDSASSAAHMGYSFAHPMRPVWVGEGICARVRYNRSIRILP